MKNSGPHTSVTTTWCYFCPLAAFKLTVGSFNDPSVILMFSLKLLLTRDLRSLLEHHQWFFQARNLCWTQHRGWCLAALAGPPQLSDWRCWGPCEKTARTCDRPRTFSPCPFGYFLLEYLFVLEKDMRFLQNVSRRSSD